MKKPVTDREMIDHCFTRITVLESLFIELLDIATLGFANSAEIRNAVFEKLREDLMKFGKKTDENGSAYTRMAIEITDQIEKRMLTRMNSEAKQ